MKLIHVLLASLTVVIALPAAAQEFQDVSTQTKPVEVNLGAQLGIPLASSADRFNPGYGFTAGVTFNPNQLFGIQAEYQFSYYDVKTGTLANLGIDGNHYMHYGDLNLVARPIQRENFGFYVLGGPGLYYRRVTITEVTGVAVVPYCDPWLYFCYNAAVPAQEVLTSRDTWDFGLNAGIGATLGSPMGARLYFEVRYHYIFGPEFTNLAGETKNADGQYLPLIIGVKF